MIGRIGRWLQGGDSAAPAEAARIRVLMVCMGNICRSPTAEGVLRAKLQRAGLHGVVQVDSAGTHGYHSGEAPDARAIRHAAQRGYDIAGLRARPVLPHDFMQFQRVLAMDEDNLDWLRRKAPPGAVARIEPLLAHARQHPGTTAVPDPYYGGPAGFDHVLDLVEDACDGLVAQLQAELRAAPPRHPG
jgi:protein-tyrosine phosphatase